MSTTITFTLSDHHAEALRAYGGARHSASLDAQAQGVLLDLLDDFVAERAAERRNRERMIAQTGVSVMAKRITESLGASAIHVAGDESDEAILAWSAVGRFCSQYRRVTLTWLAYPESQDHAHEVARATIVCDDDGMPEFAEPMSACVKSVILGARV